MIHRATAVSTVVLITMYVLLACGGGKTPTPLTTPTTVSAVSVAISGRTSLAQSGETSQLAVIVTYSDGTTKETSEGAIWSAQPSNVVSITPGGLLTALAYGTGTVTVRYGSPPVGALANVRVLPEGMYILKGQVKEAGFAIEGARVEATSSAPTVATVTDVGGAYTLLPVGGDAVIRTEKTGYVTEIRRITAAAGDQRLDFDLQRDNPFATVDGVYTLTITPSSSCATLPSDVMHRTYTTQVTDRHGDLVVVVRDANYFWGDARFSGSRAERAATFSISDDLLEADPIFDLVSADAFLTYAGTAVGEITDRRIAAILNGRIYVRHLRPGDGIIAECRAVDHRLEFVR